MNNGFSYMKNTGALLKAFKMIREQIPLSEMFLVGNSYGRGGSAEPMGTEKGIV